MASRTTECTLKRKGAPSSNGPTPPPGPSTKHFSTEFRKDQNRTRYETNIMNRSIICPRRVDFSSFRSLRIEELFTRIGLSGLFNLGGPSYDRLVRLFYANLSSKPHSPVVKSYVIGHKIKLNSRIVNELIGFSMDEPCDEYYHASRDPEFIKQGQGLDLLRKIHQNPEVDVFNKPKSKDLNVKARVIHRLISCILLPRDGHKDLVSWMDLYLMEKIYNGKRFNPGYVILNHMSEIISNSVKNLPYNTLIQKIIEHFAITVPSDEPVRKEKIVDVFNHFTLGRMGIVEVQGEWVSKANHLDSSSTAPFGASTSQDISTKATPSQPSPRHWLGSMSTIEEKLDVISVCLCSLTSTVERLARQVQDLSSAQTCFEANMLAEFKKFVDDDED